MTLLKPITLAALVGSALVSSSPLVIRDDDPCVIRSPGEGQDASPLIEQVFRDCAMPIIPEGETLTIGTKLNTTGLSDTHVKLLGKIEVNPDVDYWRDNAFNVSYQDNSAIWFFGGNNVVLDGEGIGEINGNGQTFYDARIKNDSLRPPHLMVVYESDNLVMKNLNFHQSPRWTTIIHSSSNVIFHDLFMRSRSDTWALGRESNRETDGVDIYDSHNVMIHNIHVDNGDDCVSFKPNATNIFVSDIYCNGSHGVSIGSLGEYNGVKDIVTNIYVNNVTIENSENGGRIKTWAGLDDSGNDRGWGFVDQVVFANFNHTNNDSPMTIDNCYKTSPDECLANPSNMTISNVYYTNQQGSSSGKYGNAVAALICSVGKCTDIYTNNLDLSSPQECGKPVYANHHVNIQGNGAFLFESDAETYGAGGINPDNSTVSGVHCEAGKVIVDHANSTDTESS